MVNKMKLKFLFLGLFIATFAFEAISADFGTSAIKRRQHIACGINSEYKSLAYKQNGRWQGFDADICRAIAAAFLDDAEKFKLVAVKKEDIGKALNSGKIDVILGHSSLSSTDEAELYVTPIDTLYFDRQIFASRQEKDASSMRDFAGAKVCVLRNSSALTSLSEYNQKYALGFKILQLPSLASAKEAFYLKRCDLITGSEIFIKNIVAELRSGEPAQILPEEISYQPIKAYTAGSSPTLNIAMRWIINALKLAYASDITSQNISTFNATKSPSLQNLLGLTPKAWQKLNLEPEWVKDYIPIYGNYQQILDRNIGKDSALQLNMKQNDLIEKGGFLSSQPFI